MALHLSLSVLVDKSRDCVGGPEHDPVTTIHNPEQVVPGCHRNYNRWLAEVSFLVITLGPRLVSVRPLTSKLV